MYSCLEVLDYFLCRAHCIVSSFIVSHLRSPASSDSESVFACVKKIVGNLNILRVIYKLLNWHFKAK